MHKYQMLVRCLFLNTKPCLAPQIHTKANPPRVINDFMVCAYSRLPHRQGAHWLVPSRQRFCSRGSKDRRGGLWMVLPSRDPPKSACSPTNTRPWAEQGVCADKPEPASVNICVLDGAPLGGAEVSRDLGSPTAGSAESSQKKK